MVIAQNDMGFEPSWDDIKEGGDTCSIQWRISQVGCWTDWVYDPLAPIIEKKKPRTQDGIGTNPNLRWTIYEPCDTTICCARQLEVCRYGSDSVSIRDLGMLTESGADCDTVFAYPPRIALQCYNVCDYLKDFDELYGKIPSFETPEPKKHFSLDTLNNVNNDILEIHYNESLFTVKFNNSGSSTIGISLYTITGGLTEQKTAVLYQGSNIYEIDISKLITGVYFYQITIDGLTEKTGKMYLIK